MTASFSTPVAAQVAGITARQIDYWARTGLVVPSVRDATGSGSRRWYSYDDLVTLKVIKTLLDDGLKLESVRIVFDYIRTRLSEPDMKLVLVAGSVTVADDDAVLAMLERGDFVMGRVLSIGGIRRQVDAALAGMS